MAPLTPNKQQMDLIPHFQQLPPRVVVVVVGVVVVVLQMASMVGLVAAAREDQLFQEVPRPLVKETMVEAAPARLQDMEEAAAEERAPWDPTEVVPMVVMEEMDYLLQLVDHLLPMLEEEEEVSLPEVHRADQVAREAEVLEAKVATPFPALLILAAVAAEELRLAEEPLKVELVVRV